MMAIRWMTSVANRKALATYKTSSRDITLGMPPLKQTALRNFLWFLAPKSPTKRTITTFRCRANKTDLFEEVHYDAPGVILDRLIQAEVGDVDGVELTKVQSGLVRELLDLKRMLG